MEAYVFFSMEYARLARRQLHCSYLHIEVRTETLVVQMETFPEILSFPPKTSEAFKTSTGRRRMRLGYFQTMTFERDIVDREPTHSHQAED